MAYTHPSAAGARSHGASAAACTKGCSVWKPFLHGPDGMPDCTCQVPVAPSTGAVYLLFKHRMPRTCTPSPFVGHPKLYEGFGK